MKRAGFGHISMGVESGDQDVLDRSRKGIRLNQVENAVKIIKEEGIDVQLFFIIWLPGETGETVRKTIKFAIKLNPDWLSVAIIVAYPGTEIYQWAINGKNGYSITSKNWQRFDKYLGSSIELDFLSHNKMRRLQAHAYLEVYLRNLRLGDLAKLIWKNRSLMIAIARNNLIRHKCASHY